ncbi:MAG: hypothetical protein JJU29_17320 [Verrucomicrobia bacterium]|nr:hypothetical protein [Verrucomicrobiota bacterium]MCH8510073.1 hypothetical protein [Kiritimatiellia bacterium]
MPPKLSTAPLDWFLSGFDSILGSIFLLSMGMGLGVASIAYVYDWSDFILISLGWPITLCVSIIRGWGLLIAPLLVVVFLGMLGDVWNESILFAWAMVLGVLTRASLGSYAYEFEIGWHSLVLLLPASIFFFGYGAPVQRWCRKHRKRQPPSTQTFELDEEADS